MMKRAILLIAAFLVLLGALAHRAPDYLRYATTPIAAEAVVLFLGERSGVRGNQAVDLVNAGLARRLIVPINRAVIEVQPPLTAFSPASTYHRPAQEEQKRRFPFFVEGTHVEMLAAKELMDQAGIRSANLVSSPYHMRRVKIIADRVFGQAAYTLAFVPTAYEKPAEGFWLASPWDRNWVLPEGVKILWFWLYEPILAMLAPEARE
jgi:uncharacterized SAM-binding protein YcdF (DUF218 family)